MNSTSIQLSELYGRSYLLRILYSGLGRILTVPGACLLWAVVQVGLFVTLSWWQGTLFPEGMPGGVSLLEDTTALGWY